MNCFFKFILFVIFCLFVFLSCSRKKNVLIVGDSILVGYKLSEENSPVKNIARKISKNCVLKCEIGYTVSAFSQTLSGYDVSNISGLIIELGANDFLLQQSLEKTRENFERIINYFSIKGIPICIISFIDETMFEASFDFDSELLKEYERL